MADLIQGGIVAGRSPPRWHGDHVSSGSQVVPSGAIVAESADVSKLKGPLPKPIAATPN